MIIKNDLYTIYFGNSKDNISKPIDCVPQEIPLAEHHKFIPIIKSLNVQNIAFLNQTHSIDGMIVNQEVPAFNKDGDYLITMQKNIGLGIMSADCLPIVFYDKKNHVAAIAHAGWRGSVAGVAVVTMEAMKKYRGTLVDDLDIVFGPSAKQCCYIVGELVVNNIKDHTLQVIEQKSDGSLLFDLPRLSALQLHNAGYKNPINMDYNLCTICDYQFFSARRQQIGRQMSIIALK